MAYKLKVGRPRKIPENYYENKEISELKKEYHGHPPFEEISRVGTRRAFHLPSRMHEKNRIVSYRDNYAIVREVRRDGLILEPFKKDKDDFDIPSGKLIFVPEKEVSHTVYPSMIPDRMVGDLIM